MPSNKKEFYANVFVPLDISCILIHPHMFPIDIFTHVLNCDGNSWLASSHLEYFMNNMVNNNIFYEDMFMKTFSYTMKGEDGWD